jgi:GT2 family glycosyltransferase
MELVVIGTESKYAAVALLLRQRGIKVVLVPGAEIVVYAFHSGFQELAGKEAEHYIQSLLLSPYIIEYH